MDQISPVVIFNPVYMNMLSFFLLLNRGLQTIGCGSNPAHCDILSSFYEICYYLKINSYFSHYFSFKIFVICKIKDVYISYSIDVFLSNVYVVIDYCPLKSWRQIQCVNLSDFYKGFQNKEYSV